MSLSLEDPDFSSSTPIKKEHINKFDKSVEDLLEVINSNISSASLNEHSGSNSFGSQTTEEDDISPIKPLNLKQQVLQQADTLKDQSQEMDSTEILEKVMEDIPRPLSLDELDFNTRVNRTSSLSRISGPRQLSNSALRRTFSNRSSPQKSPSKSLQSADNSPSKKSVCFEQSPPKIMEYDELTPENSDESDLNDTFESKWKANMKAHPLPPPPPPKHVISTSSPQKETSLLSSDESQEIELTRENLKAHSVTLGQKLDLVLNNDNIAERVQYDESFHGSGSPSKPELTQEEHDILYSIKNKKQKANDEALALASSMFEEDVRNTDTNSKTLKLDPVLKRKDSVSSLNDEERILTTRVVSTSEAPITLEDGMKHINPQVLASTDSLLSQVTSDAYQSATEIMDSSDESVIIRNVTMPSKESCNSIATLREAPLDITRANALTLTHNLENPMGICDTKDEPLGSITSNDTPGISSASQDDHSLQELWSQELSVESETENLRPEPPISLPIFDTQEAEASLTDDLRGSEVFSKVLENTNASADEDVRSEHESDKEMNNNEEVIEGYRSLSPKKRPIPPLIRTGVKSMPTQFDVPDSTLKSQESMVIAQELAIDTRNAPAVIKEIVSPTSSMGEIDDNCTGLQPIDLQSSPKLQTGGHLIDDSSSFIEQPLDDAEKNNEPEKSLNPTVEDPSSTYLLNSGSMQPLDEEFNYNNENEYRSLNPSTNPSPVKATGNLPSYNSLLFHDKEPEDVGPTQKPADYISIWHSQPSVKSPNPQYSIRQRKPSPPNRVLKLLARTLKDDYDIDEEDVSTNGAFVKKEEDSSLMIPDDLKEGKSAFVTKSASRSSYINLDRSRRSSLIRTLSNRSSFILSEPQVKQEVKNETAHFDGSDPNTSGMDLPDITTSSDFGNAFKDWYPSTILADESTSTKRSFETLGGKSIWGSNEPSPLPVTPSVVNQGQLQSLIEKNSDSDTQFKSQGFNSEVIVGNGQDMGVDIEFDQESHLNLFQDEVRDNEVSGRVSSSPELQQQRTFRLVSNPNTNPFKSDLPINMDNSNALQKRAISGTSQASGFNLNYEFDRLVQLQDGQRYAVHEKDEVIIANSETHSEDPNLELDQLDKDFILTESGAEKYESKVSSQRVRTPLAGVHENKLNRQKTRNSPPHSNKRIVSNASSENNHQQDVSELMIKKRVASEIKPVKSQQSLNVDLPNNDKGRLYIHINSLRNVLLDEIKVHNATFKLYIDNGKHKISTPKFTLDTFVEIDKEFEMAVENETTDLFLTLKICYTKPENELVEVIEKVPISHNNRLSRLIGIKPKFRREKKFVSRKRLVDEWDKKFATDGSFGKNKIVFDMDNNRITGQTKNYSIELFNEWSIREQSGKDYKLAPYMCAKLDVTMLFVPRTSPLESLPPSIKTAERIVQHLVEQSELVFEGYLYQEGGDCELWRRRFFKIKDNKLIAHNENTRKPKAQINLLKVSDVIHSGRKTTTRRNFTEEVLMSDTFKLAFKNGEIISFNAETKELKDQWIDVLQKFVSLNKFHQPWSKLLLEKNQEST